MHTASTALLEALEEAGVTCIFANLGSDHSGLLEAMLARRAEGRMLPALLTSPNEFVAMSAADGHARASGQAQCVLVHVECGTQSLAGAVHNAAKGRVPVLVLAGTSPFTQDGELPGSRNEHIHWLQDVPDQRGLVRGYMRYDNEIRTGRNVRQIVHRAMQFAHSAPQGPVYLMAAREVLEEQVPPSPALDPALWRPLAPAALPPDGVAALTAALLASERPLVVTSYLGRNPEAVAALQALCHALALPVLDSVPSAMNFPADDPLYQGCQWNERSQNPALAEADLVLVIDSDVPWIPAVSRPPAEAAVFHIDVDPLKEETPLWYLPARQAFRADAATALRQLLAGLAGAAPDHDRIVARRARLQARFAQRQAALAARERPDGNAITAPFLMAALRRRADADTVVLNEGITNYTAVNDHMMRTRPGTLFTSGAGSLGWNGGAAIGVKLARPEATVFAIGGDGCYLFSQPSTVHWMARRYRTPFLQVVLNNAGWRAPRLSALSVHPDGWVRRSDDIGVSFQPLPDYAGIAVAAGGALGVTIGGADELEPALDAAMRAIHEEHRAAVLDVRLAG